MINKSHPYLFLLPAIILIFFVIAFPLGYSFYISLHRVRLTEPFLGKPFTGMTNYAEILSSNEFQQSLLRTLYFVAISVAGQLILGLGMALLLNEKLRGMWLARTLIILPWSLPPIITGIMWMWVFQADYGLLNGVLRMVGILNPSEIYLWLGDPSKAMSVVIFTDIWRTAPIAALIVLGGLSAVSVELYDAAKVDGASTWQRFRHITLPNIRSVLLVVLTMRTMFTLQTFDMIYALTGGGPGDVTRVLAYYIYTIAFRFLDLGQACAMGYTMTLLVVISAIIYTLLLYRS